MNRLAIVMWSGTGNTEQMAECIAQGAREAGAQVELLGPEAFSAGRLGEFDVVAFGCPAMGAEQLEEDSFELKFPGYQPTGSSGNFWMYRVNQSAYPTQ